MPRPFPEPDDTTYRGRFAARFRELRTKKYATREDFLRALAAGGLEISPNTLTGWETGYRQPKIEMLPRLAEALGVSVRTLLPPG